MYLNICAQECTTKRRYEPLCFMYRRRFARPKGSQRPKAQGNGGSCLSYTLISQSFIFLDPGCPPNTRSQRPSLAGRSTRLSSHWARPTETLMLRSQKSSERAAPGKTSKRETAEIQEANQTNETTTQISKK